MQFKLLVCALTLFTTSAAAGEPNHVTSLKARIWEHNNCSGHVRDIVIGAGCEFQDQAGFSSFSLLEHPAENDVFQIDVSGGQFHMGILRTTIKVGQNLEPAQVAMLAARYKVDNSGHKSSC